MNQNNTTNEKRHLWKVIVLSTVICLLSMVPALLFWNRIPAEVPIHFNMQGLPDSWAPKGVAVIGLPVGLGALNVLALWATLFHASHLDDKIKRLCIGLVPTLAWGIALLMLGQWLGLPVSITRLVLFFLGTMFIILGNYLPKAGQNRYFGLRTPATLRSEVVWNKSNRLCGYLMLLAGILIDVEVFLLPEAWLVPVAVIEILAASLIPIVYAQVLAHQEQRAGQGH